MSRQITTPLHARKPDAGRSWIGWAPIYTTHGHGRKTHVALIDASGNNASTLCSTKDRHPDLMWSCGDMESFSKAAEWVGTDSEGFGCAICKRKLLALALSKN